MGIQPARGYDIDISATYHDADLVPPHGYLAYYAWLRNVYRAHAIVQGDRGHEGPIRETRRVLARHYSLCARSRLAWRFAANSWGVNCIGS